MSDPTAASTLRPSPVYTPAVIEDIQAKAELGRYRIRGFGTLREQPLPSLDDLTFLPCGADAHPARGLPRALRRRRPSSARATPSKPIELDIPVMITGMSFGALSYNAKVALARGRRARRAPPPPPATAACCPPSARTPATLDLRGAAEPLRHQRPPPAPGRRHRADHRPGRQARHRRPAARLQGVAEIAAIRDLPPGVDQRRPARHPDFLGPDDMIIKIEELREATDWQVPIFVKMGATPRLRRREAGRQGGRGRGRGRRHGGRHRRRRRSCSRTTPASPPWPRSCEARRALEDLGLYGKVQLDHRRRHPQRHRRGQGDGARRGRRATSAPRR